MMRIAVVPGDGVGPEVTAEVLKVLAHFGGRGLPVQTAVFDFSAQRYLATGRTLDGEELQVLADHDALFMGAFGDPRVPDMRHARDILLGVRRGMDLYVNERPLRLLHPRLCPLDPERHPSVNLVVFRENTEGEYSGAGGTLRFGTPHELAVEEVFATRMGVERLIRHAFRESARRGIPSVTLCDKHNAQRHTGDLWHRVFLEVAREFPQVEARHAFVDALCMRLVMDPSQFHAVVASNLFGDILSDLGAALVGGPGLAPSANYNPETRKAMFEPVHGSAPDIAGKGVANPFAALLSASMMLEFLGFHREARALEVAVGSCVMEGETTRDLGGSLGTVESGDAVVRRLRAAGE
jgi:3-isopropylmalate dehydrogenase